MREREGEGERERGRKTERERQTKREECVCWTSDLIVCMKPCSLNPQSKGDNYVSNKISGGRGCFVA